MQHDMTPKQRRNIETIRELLRGIDRVTKANDERINSQRAAMLANATPAQLARIERAEKAGWVFQAYERRVAEFRIRGGDKWLSVYEDGTFKRSE